MIHAVFTPDGTNPHGLTSQDLQYSYDAAGNRIFRTVNGVTTSYAVNSVNEYTSSTTAGIGTTEYQYHPDGNVIAMTDADGHTTTYAFNDVNQLTAVSAPGLSASYSYDPLGNLALQTVNGVTTSNQIDPTGLRNLVAQYDGAGNLIAHFTYGMGLTSRVSASNVTGFYDFNRIGSTVGITDASGEYVNGYWYEPFGTTTTLNAAIDNPFTFVGQMGVTGGVSDTFGMRQRFYDADTGQFLSQDPLGHAAIDVDGHYLSKYPFGGNLLQSLWPGSSWPAIYNSPAGERGWPPDHAYTFTVNERAAGAMAAQIDALKSANANWNLYGAICAEDVESVLTQGFQVSKDEMGWAPVYLDYYLETHNFQDPSCDPPHPNPPDPEHPDPDHPDPNWPNIPRRPLGPIPVPVSNDPNEMYGPAGFGTDHWLASQKLLAYTVEFENDPEKATAPALDVTVTETLDADLDWTNFELGDMHFGSTDVIVPAGLQSYQTSVITTNMDDSPLRVDISAGLDLATGVVTWTFRSIDPATGQSPDSVLAGFLPVDDATRRSLGPVTYVVRPKSGSTTGTQLGAGASIVFDTNDPLATNTLVNTLDADGPTAVLADPAPGATVADWMINARAYLDVTFSDGAGSAPDAATILDWAPEFTLSGVGAAGVTVNGVPTLVEGTTSTYRYTFTGAFSDGPVDVNFTTADFARRSGPRRPTWLTRHSA